MILTGGDCPHLGAVAVAQSRKSLADPLKISATTSNISILGHKEDELTRNAASRVASAISANVAVCCGIHVDHISTFEIDGIKLMCNEVIDEAITYINAVQSAGET